MLADDSRFVCSSEPARPNEPIGRASLNIQRRLIGSQPGSGQYCKVVPCRSNIEEFWFLLHARDHPDVEKALDDFAKTRQTARASGGLSSCSQPGSGDMANNAEDNHQDHGSVSLPSDVPQLDDTPWSPEELHSIWYPSQQMEPVYSAEDGQHTSTVSVMG